MKLEVKKTNVLTTQLTRMSLSANIEIMSEISFPLIDMIVLCERIIIFQHYSKKEMNKILLELFNTRTLTLFPWLTLL